MENNTLLQNQIAIKRQKVTASMIHEMRTDVEDIYFENCIIGPKVFLELVKRLITTIRFWMSNVKVSDLNPLRKLTSLKTIRFGRNPFDFEIFEVYSILAQLPQFQELHFYQSKIFDESLKGISTINGLVELNLRLNSITDSGVTHLRKLCQLQRIYLTGNRISDEGTHKLAQITSLQQIDLSQNYLSDEGATNLTKLTSLRFLNIHSNQVCNRGFMKLYTLRSLRSLYKRGNLATQWCAHGERARYMNYYVIRD